MPHSDTASRTRRGIAVTALAIVLGNPLSVPASAQEESGRDRNGAQPGTSGASVSLPFGRWTDFTVGGAGSTTGVFRFFSDTPVLLRVTDAFCRGDEFRGLDRGFALFTTSPAPTDPSCDDEPLADTGAAAWADPSYSKGRFLLQPGHHWVRVQITESPFGVAGAFLRIDKRPVG